jgi:hypothetical protein
VVTNDIGLAVSIQTLTGWLDLQDPAGGYLVDAAAFGEHSVSHRKVEVSSGWMEGTFISRSVKDNISESLVIQVAGSDAVQLRARVMALTDAFEQITYQVVVAFGLDQQIWACTVADYQVSTSREFRHRNMAVVKATVPRLPSPYTRSIDPTTPPGEPGFWVLDDPVKSVLDTTTTLI